MGARFVRRTSARGTGHIAWRRPVLAAITGLGLAIPVSAAAAIPAAALAVPATDTVTVTSHFVSTTTDTTGDSSYLSNGATNGHPNALLFVTPNWTPGGLCGCVNVSVPIGVWYSTGSNQWAVLREDQGGMTADEGYNVLVVSKSSSSVFVHRAKASNTSGDYTWINSRLTNDKPKAMLQVTQDYNPGGKGGVYNAHVIGVKYVKSRKRWAIFNEDHAALTAGAAFNVMVGSGPSNGGAEKLLTATSANRASDTVYISASRTTGNPNNVVFLTPVWNPDAKGGTYDNAQPGVWYDGAKEAMFNENFTTVPLKSSYNMLIFSS